MVGEFENSERFRNMVPPKPSPSGALNRDSFLGKLFNKIFIGSELADNLLSKGGILIGVFTSSLSDRCQIFPIDGMIDMTT